MNLMLFIAGVFLLVISFDLDSLAHWIGSISGIFILIVSFLDGLTKVVKKFTGLTIYIKKNYFKKDVSKSNKLDK